MLKSLYVKPPTKSLFLQHADTANHQSTGDYRAGRNAFTGGRASRWGAIILVARRAAGAGSGNRIERLIGLVLRLCLVRRLERILLQQLAGRRLVSPLLAAAPLALAYGKPRVRRRLLGLDESGNLFLYADVCPHRIGFAAMLYYGVAVFARFSVGNGDLDGRTTGTTMVGQQEAL